MAAARAIRERTPDLASAESEDTGKPLSQARTDVSVAAEYLEFYGGFADKLYGDTIPLDGTNFALTFLEPLGVTGHIIPWNYPLQIGARTVAPALVCGNACVVKPAEEAPLTTIALGRILSEVGVPDGVVNVVPGAGEVAGAALAGSDDIDHLTFTGGIDTGRKVMAAAAANLKPVTMELGGKSPSVVLADADLDRAVPVITKALIQNCGQTCSAGSRVVVHRSRHDELVDRLAESLGAVQLGRGLDDPDMGPLISADQLDRVLGYLQVARDEGSEVVVGGDSADVDGLGGYFVQPTLLDGVTPGMRVANEEIFGPVLAVLAVDDDPDALRVADATPYGLIAAVWTRDVDRALWLARHLRCGQVYVNSYGAGGGVPLPFGGFKKSGFGREKGLEALREYTQVKTVAFDVAAP
ncbi:MAG: aldehyde dehydrogenase family protein [Actinomycetota bacterium]|nr:aldehyde dehydrogenase family protein [Actinomycetota bacterium]